MDVIIWGIITVFATIFIIAPMIASSGPRYLRRCLCGGTIRYHEGRSYGGKHGGFIMGGAICDKCNSSFNSGVAHWSDKDLRKALDARNKFKRMKGRPNG